jgi:K+-transporting ATPase c subunit
MNIKGITVNKTVENFEKKIVEKAFRRYDELIGSEYLNKVKTASEYFNPRMQYEMPKTVKETSGQKIDFIF